MGVSCIFGAHRWKGFKCASCGKTQNRKLVLNALRSGAATGNVEGVTNALEALDINERGFDGSTALIIATTSGQAEIVKLLLERKADLSLADSKGQTALMHAVIKGHASLVETLLAAGAKVDAKDRHGMTALFHAAFRTDVALIEILLKSGADVNVKDLTGMTPLMCAASKGDLATINQLMVAGADPTVRNFEGTNAHAIAKHYLHTVAAALLKTNGHAAATVVNMLPADLPDPSIRPVSDAKTRTQRIS